MPEFFSSQKKSVYLGVNAGKKKERKTNINQSFINKKKNVHFCV